MVPTYPITIQFRQYRGTDPAKRAKVADFNRLAKQLQDYINERTKEASGAFANFEYVLIARELGLSFDEVADVLIHVDGGHNGLTVSRAPLNN